MTLSCKAVALSVWLGVSQGCATYQTPGPGVTAETLAHADEDIAEVLQREPAAPFPVRLALARVQGNGYRQCHGAGRYCVMTVRDVENETDLQRLSRWPMISAVAPLGRLLLPAQLDSARGLRAAAAALQTDMVLVYSIDTRFTVASTDIGPLALLSLGFLPNKKAQVSATASAVLFDVRSGFVYGTAESSASEEQRATSWSTKDAIERSRLKAEAAAFQGLLNECETLWRGVIHQYVSTETRF